MIVYVLKNGEAPVVNAVEFEVMSAETIREQSVVEVTDPVIYHRGVPNAGGINDLRMVRAESESTQFEDSHDPSVAPTGDD